MKNSLALIFLFLFYSCAKEEFAINKGTQSSAVNQLTSTTTEVCAQSTLISPKVDILMLWDNSSSFNFVTPETKASMTSLITSVSENFDYHILSLPLVPASTTPLFEGVLVAKDPLSVTGNATAILRSKEQAASSLSFTQGFGAGERGVDRATDVILTNRSNGIFRQEAYTIIVLMSNEDDKGCELATGFATCSDFSRTNYLTPKKIKLLCLRGNTYENCASAGVTSLNSTMMRFINISPLTSCTSGFGKQNVIYRDVAKFLYETPYSNGWPTSNDHLSPDVFGAPDSYNLCSISFSHIFDGVNTAIKQTLLKHKYDYWPVASSNTALDPDTLRVVRSDGKILRNATGESNPSNGFAYVGNLNGQYTRFAPTPGEPFTGKMIQLFGTDGNDKIVYPHCLKITYNGIVSTFGYAYLQFGEPKVDTIQVSRSLNGGSTFTAIPQSSTNGWDYIGLQFTSALDSNLKVVNLPPGASSGYFIRLNGSYQFQNSTTTIIRVDYNSKSQ